MGTLSPSAVAQHKPNIPLKWWEGRQAFKRNIRRGLGCPCFPARMAWEGFGLGEVQDLSK